LDCDLRQHFFRSRNTPAGIFDHEILEPREKEWRIRIKIKSRSEEMNKGEQRLAPWPRGPAVAEYLWDRSILFCFLFFGGAVEAGLQARHDFKIFHSGCRSLRGPRRRKTRNTGWRVAVGYKYFTPRWGLEPVEGRFQLD